MERKKQQQKKKKKKKKKEEKKEDEAESFSCTLIGLCASPKRKRCIGVFFLFHFSFSKLGQQAGPAGPKTAFWSFCSSLGSDEWMH